MNILELPEDILHKICNIVKREEEKENDFFELDSYVLLLKNSDMSKEFKTENISGFIYDRLYKSCYEDDEINEYVKSRRIEKYYKKWWGRN